MAGGIGLRIHASVNTIRFSLSRKPSLAIIFRLEALLGFLCKWYDQGGSPCHSTDKRTVCQSDFVWFLPRFSRQEKGSGYFIGDPAEKVTRVDNGNGTAVIRQYDAADRPTLIRHEDAGGNAILQLAYMYSAAGLVTRIVENRCDEGVCYEAGAVSVAYTISRWVI